MVHPAIVVTHHDDIVDITHGGLDVRGSNLREQLTVDVHLVRRPILFDRHGVMAGYPVRVLNQEGEGGQNPEPKVSEAVRRREERKVDVVHVIINGRVLGRETYKA